MTSGLLPAVPQLSALASCFTLHQFAVQHLLCPLLVFRLFLPVTDSDKLTKAHETKKVVVGLIFAKRTLRFLFGSPE